MSRSLLKPTLLKDYRPPAFLIDSVDLVFDLHESETRVKSTCQIRRNPENDESPDVLVLNGEKLELVNLKIDGIQPPKDDWKVTEDALEIRVSSDTFELQVTTIIDPSSNKALEGLYISSRRFCTQCEAEGFRKITYFLDRPDVLAKFRVTLIADKTGYPVLLSNGNCVENRETAGGKHLSVWEDPFPKPSYLFALVAGDLGLITGLFMTNSGKAVALRIYVEHGKEARAEYALDSLIRAMQWDEDVYGLEYDLDIFNVVAVSDFNMGAMENKSLNIFNDKFILASTETATDTDYAWIESVVAHEYFHNWTGNRVTCRDWFQLSLKEGLTVFRDQQFSAEQRSYSVQRISDVKRLRAAQFSEDASPLAHPVRPECYSEINNFYTHTVYEKGAEVVRMIQSLVGSENFRKGMDIYFERYDGQAVTCEDFVASMEAASGLDLSQFKLWYSQAGTPVINAEGFYHPETRRYELKLKQSCKPTPGQPVKEPMHIPVAIGFVDELNGSLSVNRTDSDGGCSETHLISMRDKVETIHFDSFPSSVTRPTVSINRGFTAPIHVSMNRSPEDLATLVSHESDPVSRWDASQQLARSVLLQKVRGESSNHQLDVFLDSVSIILNSAYDDAGLTAQILDLPAESIIADGLETYNPIEIYNARRWLGELIGARYCDKFAALYESSKIQESIDTSGSQANRRALNYQALNYLVLGDSKTYTEVALNQYESSLTMTDRWSALLVLNQTQDDLRRLALDNFAERFSDDSLVMDKWFALEATHPSEDILDRIQTLKSHPVYDAQNPNKIRALITSFAMGNTIGFHQISGHGYRFVADQIIEIDSFNPQSAARLAGAFQQWSRYDDQRSSLIHAELSRIANTRSLSPDVGEIVGKTLSAKVD